MSELKGQFTPCPKTHVFDGNFHRDVCPLQGTIKHTCADQSSKITMIMKYLRIPTATSLFRNHDPVRILTGRVIKSFSSGVIHYISNHAANVSETKHLIKTVEMNKGRYKPGGNIYIVDFGVNCPFKDLGTFSFLLFPCKPWQQIINLSLKIPAA